MHTHIVGSVKPVFIDNDYKNRADIDAIIEFLGAVISIVI